MIIYYACPNCSGASCWQAEYYKENYIEYNKPICKRCNDNGTLTEDKLTLEEISMQIQALNEDDRARNRVD